MKDKPILVTGSTGYVGGRLVPRLLEKGYRVRAMARSPGKVRCRPWGRHPNLEVVAADILDLDSLTVAAKGCRAAYYLVHSMNPESHDFADADRIAAENMVIASGKARLGRIIYLGGLGLDEPGLSKHLQSRLEVGRILQSGPTPTTYLRAAMILGSGSASFEILRYLVDRLPIMITPRWVRTPCEPISIRNVLNYLMGCLEHDEVLGQTFDIGGGDIHSYHELMRIYAEEARLRKRLIVPVPVLTPTLSSYWIHVVTPVPASIARPLAEGLGAGVVCQDFRIREIIPQDLLTCRESIREALRRIEQEQVETCWSDAGASTPPEWVQCGDAPYAGGTALECAYRIGLPVTAELIWEQLVQIGGERGWFHGDFLWTLRGWLDRLVGGVGINRGRRSKSQIRTGDALDFWRVLDAEPLRRLLLMAEMKAPGEAILDFRIADKGEAGVEVQAIARFLPRGLAGMAYWYALKPVHGRLFSGMLKSLARVLAVSPDFGPEPFDAHQPHACRIAPVSGVEG